MVCGLKPTSLAHARNFGFNGLIIFKYQNFSAASAGHMVVMVLKYVAELQFRTPPQLQTANYAKVFKNFYVPVHRSLIVTIK